VYGIVACACELTIEKAELQQRGQGGDDHEHEQAAAPSHQPHGGAQRQAGRHGDASLGVVVGVEVVEYGRVVGLMVHHAAGETVVDPIARQPGHQRGDPKQGRQLFPALFNLGKCSVYQTLWQQFKALFLYPLANAPMHKERSIQKCFIEFGVEKPDWPAHSLTQTSNTFGINSNAISAQPP